MGSRFLRKLAACVTCRQSSASPMISADVGIRDSGWISAMADLQRIHDDSCVTRRTARIHRPWNGAESTSNLRFLRRLAACVTYGCHD